MKEEQFEQATILKKKIKDINSIIVVLSGFLEQRGKDKRPIWIESSIDREDEVETEGTEIPYRYFNPMLSDIIKDRDALVKRFEEL